MWFYRFLFSKVDKCSPNPCANNGKCEGNSYGYKCICRPGCYGNKCQSKYIFTCKYIYITKLHWIQRNPLLRNAYTDDFVYYLIFRLCLKVSPLLERTSIMHMTTSVTRRINIICLKFKIMIYSALYNNSAHVVKCKGLHFVCEKHLHDHIISIKVEVCVHKISLTLQLLLNWIYQARRVNGNIYIC